MTRITTASSDADILGVLHETADAVFGVLNANTDWGLSGKRATQYSVDLRADAAALEVLHAAGIAVMSEESGRTGEWNDDSIIVVMDPLDGSTNASRRVPWYATALCAIDGEGMRASLVVNQASGRDRYWASRGGGAFHNGIRLRVDQRNTLRDSVVGISGLPSFRPAWGQFRALGAAALDICLVATGALDGWIDFNSHGVWDYLASVLVCQEAGVVVSEFQSRDLVVTQYAEKRTPLVASSRELLDELRAVREQHQSR
ncbi:MAG: inositol monophosphatase [Actinobacteria bacterium]|nr:inositol monophosphatase [Actinomycetota bacterium]